MKVIGIMSGTSLDGVDLAFVEFSEKNAHFSFSLKVAETISYDDTWKRKLKECSSTNAEMFSKVHADYGHYLGRLVNDFIKKNKIQPDLISSHGHTIFHQPKNGFTVQIGDGSSLHAATNLPVVCDFRSTDIALGGQGAPLVPVGDQLLFNEYTYCLNLGGIANISYYENAKRIAFDICPVNMILNYLAEEVGLEYDKNGQLAEKGALNTTLLSKLEQLSYYHQLPPKSLGYEWFIKEFLPVVNSFSGSNSDKLHTVCHHIARQIKKNICLHGEHDNVFVTGGGAKNKFLVSLLQKEYPAEIIIPEEKIVDFKEALIFAFLGYLRVKNKTNVFASVTGAKSNSVSGALYGSVSL